MQSEAVAMRTQRPWDPGDTGEQWYVGSSCREGNSGTMFGLGKCVNGDFLINIETVSKGRFFWT